jgi:hypothetical protein
VGLVAVDLLLEEFAEEERLLREASGIRIVGKRFTNSSRNTARQLGSSPTRGTPALISGPSVSRIWRNSRFAASRNP